MMEAERKRELVMEFQSSGQRLREFCRARGIAESSFVGWRRGYGTAESGSGFIRVESGRGELELEFPSGIKVRVAETVSSGVLSRLKAELC